MSRDTMAVVAWATFQPRTAALAREFDSPPHFVSGGWLRRYRPLLPLRYLAQAVQTWRLLSRLSPSAVIVITPPVFAPLVAWSWSAVHRRSLIVDCHTDAFQTWKWRWARPVHRWLLRRSRAVLLHTAEAEELVRGWGATALVLPDDVPDSSEAAPQPRGSRPRVLVAGSFDWNEPLAETLAAAALLPDVEVRFTGDTELIPSAVRSRAPANAVFTGYLPYPTFLGELLEANVVAVFSTDPQQMNRAAFEAVGLGRPLVLSDHPGLRQRFGGAALFCPATEPEQMAGSLQQALAKRAALAARSRRLRGRLRAERRAAMDRLRSLLPEPSRPAPRRVLMVTQHFYPAEAIVRRNVGHLLESGFEVDLICLRDKAAPGKPPQSSSRLRVYSLPLDYRRHPAVWYILEFLAFFGAALPLACWLGARRRYDAVQVDNLPDFLTFVAFLPRLRGARVVLNMTELMPEMTRARLRLGDDHYLVRLARWVERISTRWSDRVVIMSDTCAQILLGRGVDSAKLSVVQNTFEYEQVEPIGLAPAETQTSGPFLVTHAVLIERAGVQVAIEAMALLRGRWPELRLVILGRGDHQAELELEAAQLRMTDRVVFRGFVPWHQAMQEISQAAVGIVPMLPDGYGELCLPMKLFDYASLGVPAVCSRLRAMAEHYPPDAVSFFRPGDAQDLAEKVNELLRHPEEAKAQAARAREAIRRFDWDVVSRRYLEALGLGEHAGKQASAA